MKRLLSIAFLLPLIALGNDALIYTVRTSGTGNPKERTLALTPGTTLRVAANGTLEVVGNPALISSLGLGSAAFAATGTAASQLPNNAQVGMYAVLDIELGGNYTDFELKASAANWAGGSMAYFYHSPDPAKSTITSQVWTMRPDVFFTDSQYTNPGDPQQNQRTWRKQSATQSIAAMRTNAQSVIPGVTVIVKYMGAINRYNAALIWSYCRLTPTGYEVDTAGRSIWHTITPKWISQPLQP